MRLSDLVISLAYFSIPIQIVVSLYQYPRLASMPAQIFILSVLFALFIFCCGTGHLMRCLGNDATLAFDIINGFTAFVSLATALYLLPLVPSLMSDLDSSLKKLVKLNEETAESKRKLFTFMAFLCHEIRNPLFAITTNVEFAQDMEMSKELHESLSSINQSTTLMLRLVNDVLDLSKIESGKLELDEQEFDVREFFKNIARSMSSQIHLKKNARVEFIFKLADDVPRIVSCDSVRLLQIAYNLLSNASKFTEAGSITFSISICELKEALNKGLIQSRKSFSSEEDGSEGGFQDELREAPFSMSLLQAVEGGHFLSNHKNEESHIRVLKMTIEDTGAGIQRDRVERIFQPYAQSKLSDFRKHGGTGLGLSIISKLTEIMGGTIKVESTEGTGSIFTVHLPVLVPNDPKYSDGTVPFQALHNKTHHGNERADSLAAEPSIEEAPNTPGPLFSLDSNNVSNVGTVPPNYNPPESRGPLFALDTPLHAPVSAPLFDLQPKPTSIAAATHQTNNSPAPLFALSPLPSTRQSSTGVATSAPQSSDSNTLAPVFPLNSPSGQFTNTAATPAPSSSATTATSLFTLSSSSSPYQTTSTVSAQTPTTKPKNNETKLGRNTSSEKKAALPKFGFPKNTNLVLVVDDNEVNRKLIGKMLSFFDVEYAQAQHGQEAVDIMAKSRNATGDVNAPHYGLVIMDLCMPIMDGYEAISTLRKRGLQVPIIALTANALAEGKQQALDAGANEFATKPILRNVVHAKCTQYLKQPPEILPPANHNPPLGTDDNSNLNSFHKQNMYYDVDEERGGLSGGETELICLT